MRGKLVQQAVVVVKIMSGARRQQQYRKPAPPPPQQQAMEMQQLHHQGQYRQPAPPPPHLQQQYPPPPPPQQYMGTWPGGQGYQYPPPHHQQQYPQVHPGAANAGAYPYPPPPQAQPYHPQAAYPYPPPQGSVVPYTQHPSAMQGGQRQQQQRKTSSGGNQRPPPQRQGSRPSVQQQQPTRQSSKVDSRGEQILAEGVLSRSSLVCDGINYYLLIGLYMFIVGLAPFCILILLGICCGLRASKDWRLYFTRNRIHHVRATGSGCCYSTWFIPLSDIQNITYIVGQKSILIQFVDPAKVNEYIHWCNKPLCRTTTGIVIQHVANSEEFVLAVRQHMGLK